MEILLRWRISWLPFQESVRALLSAKANMDAKSKSGRSPLWIACSEGHLEVARQLVEANANVTFCEKADPSLVFQFFPRFIWYEVVFLHIFLKDLRTWKPKQLLN